MNPIPTFIFSLPRSGSTLLQRILAGHSQIATVSEPWILLPMMYGLRRRGVAAEYGHDLYVDALTDFIDALPGGRAAYLATIHDYAVALYGRVAPEGTAYFVDKTPRYGLIVDEILEAFPDARFIFLWRNPLSVLASMMESWNNGRWNLTGHKLDLYRSVATLTSALRTTDRNVISLRYEDLTSQPHDELRRILRYLELDEEPGLLTDFASVKLNGHHGDRTGVAAYRTISAESREKWRATICNPLRKIWARRYLDWIGSERLQTMGYDLSTLQDDLDACPVSCRLLGDDVVRIVYGGLRSQFQTTMIWRNLVGWDTHHDIVHYT